MISDIFQQEQEQKRTLRQQQEEERKRAIEQSKTVPILARTETEKGAQENANQSERGEENGEALSRSPRAIAARLRAQKTKEQAEASQASAKGGTATVKQTQETIKRLKTLYRVINGAAGISLVGLVVTVVVMNGQMILGNLFKFKLVPALSLPEIIIVCFLDLLLLAIVLLIFILFAIMAWSITNPLKVFIEIFKAEWKVIKDLFDLV